MCPHKCTQCGKLYPDASPELLKGCECGSKFFFYIREGKFHELSSLVSELGSIDRIQIEKDIREVTEQKPSEPVILDLESIRIIEPGKFEIDILNLFSKKRVLVYELEEGKYVIDLASTFKADKKRNAKK